MKKIFAVGILMMLCACTKADDVKKYSEEQGWASFNVTGYRWFGCSDDDWYQTGFSAVTKDGKKVTGVVCSGLFFKGATMRLD